MNITRL